MGVTTPPKPATAQQDAARQFDFWLGEWDCSWGDGERGTNSVYLDLGDHVVVESFDARPALEYQGMSHSVYDRTAGVWKQTWVDSDGAYLDFAGRYENGVMDLRRAGLFEGRPAQFRMRWFDIERDSLSWAYERSDDDGDTWTTLWAIGYSRVL
jgi:hypothetical protein